ncbi:DUF1761 domain-containing protein [Bradyrhizobium sp. LHD-71]|uniref:DUF1761 domain-containing protein n=1 Tax=Bradyrhizobium sp. LHD-71 TaxID=3072141 RepID=UPI0028100CB7|nr:DUF1761 domain-containing protein [Bradyrhizobium sp. LHD-71]MDQ8729685.1 DUF1761 domain-containing protein [Bradyrhizobium sp. LHD-71]
MSMLPTTMNFFIMLGAAVCAWLFGAMYYGTLGKAWVAAQGSTMEEFKAKQADNVGKISAQIPFVLALIAELIMAYVLYGLMKHVAHTGPLTVWNGLISGAFIWLGFILTSIAVNNAFTGRKVMLTVIDAGHWLGVTLIIGAILGAFAS